MIDLSIVLWWMIAGWCGTPWPGYEIPRPPLPQVIMGLAVGLVGGVIGGWVFVSLWPPSEGSEIGVYVAISGIPAFAGARVLSNILQVLALGPQPVPPGKPSR